MTDKKTIKFIFLARRINQSKMKYLKMRPGISASEIFSLFPLSDFVAKFLTDV